MPITISAPIGSSTGYTINAPSLPPSLGLFWAASPANLDLAVSLPTTVTGRNLTALGRFSGRSTWRLRNGVGQTDVASANLTGYNSTPLFSQNYFLPGGTDTFVSSTFLGTHILDFGGGQRFTKAQNQGPASNDIAILGNLGPFVLRGANGNDTLTGSIGADTLFGFDGNDSLTGNSAADSLIGGNGNDTLTGSAGTDRFAYTATNQGIDTITDFTIAQSDLLQFTGSAFGGLPSGPLAANQLAAAENGVARFIYSGGVLRYDSNLAAAGGLITIANLTGAPAITNTNIVVV